MPANKVSNNLPAMLNILREEVKQWKPPIVGTFANEKNALFKILISTLLSLRTKDKTTGEASRRLFRLADTPKKMLELHAHDIEQAIYPVGFYRTKARNIQAVCRKL